MRYGKFLTYLPVENVMLPQATLTKLPLFKDIRLSSLTSITRAAKSIFPRKGRIFYNGLDENKTRYFYYIIKGLVKIFTLSADGVEINRDILANDQYFNEELLWKDRAENLYAQAMADGQVIIIPIPILKQELTQDAQLALNFLQQSLRKQAELTHALEHLAIQNAAQRIGCFLLRLCPGTQFRSHTLHIPYSKTLVATQLGMCPETFSRALLKLSKACCLKTNGENIHIPTVESLSQYVCKQCSLSYPCHL